LSSATNSVAAVAVVRLSAISEVTYFLGLTVAVSGSM